MDNLANRLAREPYDGLRLNVGRVVSVSPASYECVVRCTDGMRNLDLPCSIAGTHGTVHGSRNCSLPSVSSSVIIIVEGDIPITGVVLAELPPVTNIAVLSEEERNPAAPTAEEGGVWGIGEPGYFARASDNEQNRIDASEGRPPDVMPGDEVITTDTGGLLALRRYLTQLRASAGAALEMSSLDDFVRMVSLQYQHRHAMGETRVMNDEGDLIFEFTGTHFQPEIMGEEDYSASNEITGDFQYENPTEDYNSLGLIDPETSPKPPLHRMRVYGGALADLLQLYLSYPKSEEPDIGLLSAALGGDGRFNVRSAGGFSVARTGAIPVPKREKNPWDPEGDTELEPQPKEQFQWNEQFPETRNLQMIDAGAWRQKLDLQRFDEHVEDFTTPGKDSTDTPDVDGLNNVDKGYDRKDSNAELPVPEAEDKLDAGLFVDDNGDVLLRNARGTEVYLVGDSVRVSCGGDIIQQPGKSSITLAGKDAVIKTKGSVDISSTDKDVRVKADGNMLFYTANKGMLFQTDSEGGEDVEFTGEGEELSSHGITLKAESSKVTLYGRYAEVASQFKLILKSVTGRVESIARQVLTFAGKFMATSGDAVVKVTGGAAVISGQSAQLSGQSISLWRQDRSVKLQYNDPTGTQSPYENHVVQQAQPEFDENYVTELDLSEVKFTFRTNQDYGDVLVYQTPWQLLEGDNGVEWEEQEVNETFPWPGKENAGQGLYVTMADTVNVDLDTGKLKTRDQMQSEPASITRVSMTTYKVAT